MAGNEPRGEPTTGEADRASADLASADREYDGPLARYYDAYFTGLEGEEAFYRGLALRASGPVLEIGCGTGRTLWPVAAAGVPVTGIDRSAAMLELARQHLAATSPEVAARVELHQADVRQLSLGRRFALISLPYRTFQHLLTVEDQHAALAALLAHLQPDGRVALNTFDPLMDLAELLTAHDDPAPRSDGEFTDAEGRRVRARYVRGYDPALQWMVQHFWFDELDGNRVRQTREARLTLRYAFRYELEHLFAAHGLRVSSLHGGFDGEPFAGWGEQVWVLEHA